LPRGGEGGAAGQAAGLVGGQEAAGDVAIAGGGEQPQGQDEEQGEGVVDDRAGGRGTAEGIDDLC
jgi:hypothetical protein